MDLHSSPVKLPRADAYRQFGCHLTKEGASFRVWAPGAKRVWVSGSFCGWDPGRFPLKESGPGIFEGVVPGVSEYDLYKYLVETPGGQRFYKADPFAFHSETPPGDASKAYDPERFQWEDGRWMAKRAAGQRCLNLYELHPGSFRTYASGDPLNYRNLAAEAAAYVREQGFTGICLAPVLEHPDDSGKTSGFFSPTSRFGAPRDFLEFVSVCHQADLSVWGEWRPEGFPVDQAGLAGFSGSRCFEAREDWERTDFRRFDFENPKVVSFLLSSAFFLLEVCHLDGLWVRGSSRISRQPGGKAFLQELNRRVREAFPGVLTAGKDPDAGFSLLWEDGPGKTLVDFAAGGRDSPDFTSSGRGILALGEEVLTGMGDSLMGRMPGQYKERFARLRAVMALFYALPGGKLLFMGSEFAQISPWAPRQELEWGLLDYEMHRKFQTFSRNLNDFYRKTPALWGTGEKGFSLIPFPGQVLGFVREDPAGNSCYVLANLGEESCQVTLGVNRRGKYTELFSTDALPFGGEGRLGGTAFSKLRPAQEKPFCLERVLPPLSTLYLCGPPSSGKKASGDTG